MKQGSDSEALQFVNALKENLICQGWVEAPVQPELDSLVLPSFVPLNDCTERSLSLVARIKLCWRTLKWKLLAIRYAPELVQSVPAEFIEDIADTDSRSIEQLHHPAA